MMYHINLMQAAFSYLFFICDIVSFYVIEET